MSNSNDKEYKRLKKIWYKKLEKSGFEDIEIDDTRLVGGSSKWKYTKDLESSAAKQEYYELATRFLNEHEFETTLEKAIWEYHSNGISYRNTAKLLKKAGVKRVSYTIVYQKVNNLKKLMVERYVTRT